jgi:recombination protein RecA
MKQVQDSQSVAKRKALDDTITNIEKQYGKGTIMRLGDKPNHVIDVIPTGCISLDYALGVGGIPRGRIIEIYGPEAGGSGLYFLFRLIYYGLRTGHTSSIDSSQR